VAKSINYTVLVVTTNTRRASCPMWLKIHKG
jgi:hypothetical protein